jgi:protocatechuate 3,4-dioxygenase alpha subunit
VTTGPTPSQTIGPFFGFALPWVEGPSVVADGTTGAIHLGGRLLDGAGDPIPDGLIETWQADGEGRFPDAAEPSKGASGFRGFGRHSTDREGRYGVLTLKPGKVSGPDGAIHAPHILVSVFARGLLRRLVTRIYFPDEEAANAIDPVLASIKDARARATLIASKAEGGYVFDIRLQGEGETLFFDP